MPHTLREHFENAFPLALLDLDLESTVGLTSLRVYGNTVGEFLKGSPALGTADPDRVEMLKAYVWQRLNDPSSPDVIRAFVKSEAHKKSKLAEGRLRLISAVSLVDTMCDRIMFMWLQKKILSTMGVNSCAMGLSPFRGGYRWYREYFRGKKTRALDMTAWDWTVPGWLLRALKEVVKHLAVLAPDYWKEWVDRRWEALFRDAVFGFADGTTVSQPGWGVMKSGCYLTLALNTFGQIVRHYLVCNRIGLKRQLKTVFCGDDQTVEDFPEFPQYEAETRALGFLLKDSVVSVDVVHFIGFVMHHDFFLPEYRDKHAFVLLHTRESKLAEVLSSYQYLYCFDAEWFSWIQKMLARLSPNKVVSSWFAKEVLVEQH